MKKTKKTTPPASGEVVAGGGKLSELWAAMAAFSASPERLPPGTGWITREDLQRIWGISTPTTCARIRTLKASGLVETFNGTKSRDGGRPTSCVWYRLKKGTR